MKSHAVKSPLKSAILALTAGILLLPMAAQATCTVNGPVVRVTTYDDSYTSTGCYIYMRTGALSSYYYYAYSYDDNMCTNAVIAATTGVDAYAQGNASSCPSSGGSRGMGQLRYLIINP
jgi:hypothetical protein